MKRSVLIFTTILIASGCDDKFVVDVPASLSRDDDDDISEVVDGKNDTSSSGNKESVANGSVDTSAGESAGDSDATNGSSRGSTISGNLENLITETGMPEEAEVLNGTEMPESSLGMEPAEGTDPGELTVPPEETSPEEPSPEEVVEIKNPRPIGDIVGASETVGGGGAEPGSELHTWLMNAIVFEEGDVIASLGYPETVASAIDGDWSTFWRNRTNAKYQPTTIVIDLHALNKPECVVSSVLTQLNWDTNSRPQDDIESAAVIALDLGNLVGSASNDGEPIAIDDIVFNTKLTSTSILTPADMNTTIDLTSEAMIAGATSTSRFVRVRWIDREDYPNVWNGYGSIYDIDILCKGDI